MQYTIKASFDALQLSLTKQENDKFLETIGHKLNQLYVVKGIIYKADRMLQNRKYGWDENLQKADVKQINNALIKFLLSNLNPLLEHASSVDYDFFYEIKTFVDDTRSYFLDFSDESFEKLTQSVDALTTRIEVHESRICEKFKEASNIVKD